MQLIIFFFLCEFNNIPIPGNVYELYRVSLAVFEVKVKVCQRSVTAIQGNEDDYANLVSNEDMISAVKSVVVLPDQLTTIYRALGKVKVGDKLYVSKIGAHNETRDGDFVPQSEQVTFSNLRQTVLSLANLETPAAARRRFYRNNPIPGAIWCLMSRKKVYIGWEHYPVYEDLSVLRCYKCQAYNHKMD